MSANAVTLLWNTNSEPDVIGYHVFSRLGSNLTKFTVGKEASIALSNLAPGLTYVFYVTAFNSAGLESDPSQELSYQVPEGDMPPLITDQPQGQTVLAGQSLLLKVEVTGTPPLGFQWFKNGELLVGKNAPDLTIPFVVDRDAGSYRIQITNRFGSAMSVPVEVRVQSLLLKIQGTRGLIEITASGVPQARYDVEVAFDLATTTWMHFGTVTAGEEGDIYVAFNDSGARPAAYYRLVLHAP